MLTIQSNLKIQDLETLSKTLIKPDIINFGLSKVGGGYTDEIADKVIAKLSNLGKDKTIVIINDITLQMADKLLEVGYKNIYLAFGSFNKDGTISKDKTVYNIMKAVIENNIKEKLNAISLEEIFSMKIDGIIANPPYGAIGANIAYTIREKIDYECFVNLLPANDYKRNKTKDLFNYQSEMEHINAGFGKDADVTTHLCLINKSKSNNMTLDEFERSQYIDRSLDKYFELNYKRNGTAFDNYDCGHGKSVLNWSPKKTFIIQSRNISDHYMGGKKSAPYIWNKLKQFTAQEFVNKYNSGRAIRGGYIEVQFYGVTFNSEAECTNFVDFVYSNIGHKFISKIFTSINTDGGIALTNIFPKVDWNHPWTVEEILRDYNYTEEEIIEVMNDLDNFKGMDD